MAKKGGDVIFRLLGDDNHLAKTLFKSKARVKAFGGSVANSLSSIGRIGIGTGSMIGGGIAGLGVGEIVSQTAQYESALNQIRNLGVKDMEAVSRAIRETSSLFGLDLVRTTNIARDAISTFGTEGQGLADSLIFTRQAAKAAVAGYVDLGDASKAVTSILKQFDLSTERTTEIMDKLKVATDLGITDMTRFAPEITKLGLTFKNAGMDYETMISALASMSLVEQDVSRDTMMLRNLMKVLGGGVREASDYALKNLKLELSATALESKGLAGMMHEVMRATDGNKNALRRLFPDMDAYDGYLTLAKVLNTDYVRILGQVNAAMGGTDTALSNVLKHDPAAAFNRLAQALTNTASAQVGLQNLTMVMNDLADAMSGVDTSNKRGGGILDTWWGKFVTSGSSGLEMWQDKKEAAAEAAYQQDIAGRSTMNRRHGLTGERAAQLAEQAKRGQRNVNGNANEISIATREEVAQPGNPSNVTGNAYPTNITISHANFTMSDEDKARVLMRLSNMPGVP